MQIPVITTERLLLRAFGERDIDEYAAIMADPLVTRFLSDGRPLSRLEAWRQMAMVLGHWTLRGYGIWAVEERATGRLIGRIGCQFPDSWPGFEIAYTLGPPFWGRGFAKEGAAAALKYARTVLKREEILSVIRPDNVGSISVATSLGAVRSETVEFFGAPADLYRYPRLAVSS